MGHQAAHRQLILPVLTQDLLQRLDPTSRAEITKLLRLLLNECVGLAKAGEAENE
jgi:hypothetical protein